MNRPSKLRHIKNQTILDNSFDPISKKYVKKIFGHKQTKLGRDKRHLEWEYYRHRLRTPVIDTIKRLYQKNIKNIAVIYFDDPIIYRYEIHKRDKKKLQAGEHLFFYQ